ncbi:MFS transporter [Candidatus Woesearchaeota archaeon]|nr:MFS transporter [Candidatus Woesearchaeota archaeon]
MRKKIWGINLNVYLLGVVSFLTDVSSEAIFSVFSIFFTAILGASVVFLGLIEGLSDFAASSLDHISGMLSDRTGKRKLFSGLGYGFSTLAKVILFFSNTIALASFFRVIERLGKSFRGPPRDAWISSLTNTKNRGLSFGIHKALDKAGAILGPLIAYLMLAHYGETSYGFKMLFLIALIPAALAVLLLIFIKEKSSPRTPPENIFVAYKNLSSGYKHYLYSSMLFSFAYFSFGFLLLKAYLIGFTVKDIVLLYALFNLSFVIVSAPIGKLGDIIGRKRIIFSGYLLYVLMNLGFIFASTKLEVLYLFILFGIFYSIDESQSKAYISDLETVKRGTAIGLYNFMMGLVYLPASLIAGFLWKINSDYAFVFGAVIAVIALLFFSLRARNNKDHN